jgi:hypothetical protein
LSVVLRRRGGFGDDGVLDGADALDLDAHQLTWFQQSSGEEADAAGRPGGDEVAGLQRRLSFIVVLRMTAKLPGYRAIVKFYLDGYQVRSYGEVAGAGRPPSPSGRSAT